MNQVNLIVVFNKEKDHVLMCHRTTDPYRGLYNFVGGKVEDSESSLEAAYRELYEETNISYQDLTLIHFMNYQYLLDDLEMNIFYGVLLRDVFLKEEKHPLVWFDIDSDFKDEIFAGDGNTYHMMKIARSYLDI